MLQLSDIRILYMRELRAALRERNIILNTFLLPVFMYPLLLWIIYTGMTFVAGQTEEFVSRVMVQGGTDSSRQFENEIENEPKIERTRSTDPEADIRNGDLDVLVEVLPPPDAIEGNFRIRLTYDDSKDRSRTGHQRIADMLSRYRAEYLENQAENLGLSRAQYQQFWVEMKNIATEQQMGRFILGILVPMMLIVMVSIGGMYAAIDSTAGEREKSTWETIMTVATSRSNIIVAKYLYVASMGSIAGLLNFIAMVFSMKAVLTPLLGNEIGTMAFTVPWLSVPLIMLLTILLALFISSGMMILASFARTFKEAQSMVTPFYVVIILPIMFLNMPGIEFSLPLAVVPVANVCMVFREAIMGIYHWPQIAVTILVEVGGICLLLWVATVILRYEDFLIGAYEGNIGKFLKERVFGSESRTGGEV